MNSHQRRKVARAISLDKGFRLYDSRRYIRLIVFWGMAEGRQTFGKRFDRYVQRAKEIRARRLSGAPDVLRTHRTR